MKFKICSVLTVAAILLASSCGSPVKKKFSNADIELTIWETYNQEEHQVFLDLSKRFEKNFQKKFNKSIYLNIQRVPFADIVTNIKLAAQTATTPDIARIDIMKVVDLAYGQVIYPLDTLSTFGKQTIEDVRKDFVPAAFDSNVIEIKNKKGEWERHLYGLPEQSTCVALYWNKKMFNDKAKELKAAGLDPTRAPKTWDEFIKYGQIITDKKTKTFAYGMSNGLWWSLPEFNSYGAKFIEKSADGKLKCVLDNPQAIAAYQMKVDLYKKYGVEAGAWQSGAISPEQGFINYNYAMILSGPWRFQTFKNAGIPFGLSLIPEGPAGTSTNIGGNNYVVAKSCQTPEYAYEFLKFISSDEVQTEWCNKLSQIPVKLSVIDKLDLKDKPELKVFIEQIKYAKSVPTIPRYGIVENDCINPELDAALSGAKTVEQALKDASRKVDETVLNLVNE